MLDRFFPNTPTAKNIKSTLVTQRIDYIDCLRGFTMFLVVYSHVVLMLLDTQCITNNLFMMFRMPLFYFISGFFCYSSSFTAKQAVRRLKNRVFQQFLPTVVMMTLFLTIFEDSFYYCPLNLFLRFEN